MGKKRKFLMHGEKGNVVTCTYFIMSLKTRSLLCTSSSFYVLWQANVELLVLIF